MVSKIRAEGRRKEEERKKGRKKEGGRRKEEEGRRKKEGGVFGMKESPEKQSNTHTYRLCRSLCRLRPDVLLLSSDNLFVCVFSLSL